LAGIENPILVSSRQALLLPTAGVLLATVPLLMAPVAFAVFDHAVAPHGAPVIELAVPAFLVEEDCALEMFAARIKYEMHSGKNSLDIVWVLYVILEGLYRVNSTLFSKIIIKRKTLKKFELVKKAV
jgi:hypothetical protein